MSDCLDGELGDELAAVERHLRRCPGCRRMVANFRRTVGGLHRLGNRAA